MKVITLGTFDLPHYGHFNLLKNCREIAGNDEVVVALNKDEFIERYKGKSPIMTFEERKKTLLMLPWVDVVVPNRQVTKDTSAMPTIVESGAKIVVVGSDWARKDYIGQLHTTWEEFDKYGIGIAYANYTWDMSTTKLKERIK